MQARIYKAPAKGRAFFQCDYSQVEIARGIPSFRKWVPESKHWEFKITVKAVRYLQNRIPDLLLDTEVQAFMDEEAKKHAHAVHLKAEATGVTANDIRDYKFKTPPFNHQAEVFLRSRELETFALFMEQGTGKTKVIIDTAAYLYGRGKITALLVTCPNSVKTNWVFDELQAHMPDWVEYDAAYWEATPRKHEVAALEQISEPNGKLKIVVFNIEGLSTKRAEKFALSIARKNSTLLVVDESDTVKSYSAQRSAACRHISAVCTYRRIMTGTPVTQGPMDLYSQFAVLGEEILGFSSYYTFRNHYAIMGGYDMKEVVGYQNLDELYESIDPFSFRCLKKDCLDLPEKLYQKIYVEHTPEQARVYKNMKKNMLSDLADGSVASATLALTKLGKLQQINSNHTKNEAGELTVIDPKHNPRLDALIELLSRHAGKAIIWTRYVYDIKVITEALNHHFGRGCAAAFYGDVDTDERQRIKTQFQEKDNDFDFFVGNPAAGGVGLTLTAATLVVYYANDFSLRSRLQSEDRAHRIGQTENVTYVDIICRGTVDEKVVDALRKKRDLSALVTRDTLTEWI